MNTTFKTLPGLIATIVMIGIPIYYDSAWWFLLSWIPAFFVLIMTDDWHDIILGKPQQPLYRPDGSPNIAPMSWTEDRTKAREPQIGELCVFWDDQFTASRISTLKRINTKTDPDMYQDSDHHAWWRHCAPIYDVRYKK